MKFRLVRKTPKFFYKALLLGFLTTLYSCSSEPEVVKDNYFIRSNEKYKLNYGIIKDDGTDYEITGRRYRITLKSANSAYPNHYFKFNITSTSTTRLNEGDYRFGTTQNGNFNNIEIGCDLIYDQTLTAIDGDRINMDPLIKNGTMHISKLNDNYAFEFELTSSDSTQHTTGYFNDILHDETIYH